MPILASRLLGASLAFSGYKGAPIAAWVSPWSKLYASTDMKKKKKKRVKRLRVFLNEDLEFNMHWKGRFIMARKMLGHLMACCHG